MEDKQKKRFYKRNGKSYVFLLGTEVTLFTFVLFVVTIIGTAAAVASLVKPSKTVVLKEKEERPSAMVVDKTPFNKWVKSEQQYNDIVYSDGVISLSEAGYKRQYLDILKGRTVHDPQGYIQSPQSISENVFICTKVLSKSKEIDYSLRLNFKFQIIFGDGDDRSLALKQLNVNNPNWDYIVPDVGVNDSHVDTLNRYRLEVPLPTDREFISCLTIHSPQGENSKNISVELNFLDDEGHKMDVGPTPSWTLVDTQRINGGTNNYFSVGLIDSRGAHPELELTGYCAVEMNDIGDRPSQREQDACRNP